MISKYNIMYSCFNPRLRAGGDGRVHAQHGAEAGVSIHASAREATPLRQCVGFAADVSIHASAREATAVDGPGCGRRRVSIHASAREATSINVMPISS